MGGGASKSKKKSSTAALATAEAPPAATAPAASDPSVSDADVTPGTPATKHISAPIPWEQVIKVTRADLNLSPPPPLDSDLAVSLRGVPGYEHLNGTGAKIIQAMGNDTWRVQPENLKSKPIDAPGSALTPLPPLPKDGVSAACLRSFRAEYPQPFADGSTTTDLCFAVVHPLTKQSRCALATNLKHLGVADPSSGEPCIARATVFISHAWRYKAVDIFDAIEAFEQRAQELEPEVRQYYWFDLFVNDQHEAVSLPQLWWREAFLSGVRDIGHTCVVLAPWTDPIPLTRAWCLWEILSTIRTGSKLSVQMPPKEADSFHRALEEDFEKVQGAVASLDGRRAEAWQKTDQKMIKAAVVQTIGFTELNSLVSERMREWLCSEGRVALERLPPAERGRSRLIQNLGRLLHEQRHMKEAEALLREAHEVSAAHGGDDANTLNRLNNLAGLCRTDGRLAQAEEMFRRALEGFRKIDVAENDGVASVDTVTTMNNLAELLQTDQRGDEALPLLSEARGLARVLADERTAEVARRTRMTSIGVVEAGLKRLEDSNPMSLYLTILNNLASLYQQQGGLEDAEPLLREALEMRRQLQGPRHAQTLLVLNNLANVLKQLGGQERLDQAVKYYREALMSKKETLGAQHESTLKSMNK